MCPCARVSVCSCVRACVCRRGVCKMQVLRFPNNCKLCVSLAAYNHHHHDRKRARFPATGTRHKSDHKAESRLPVNEGSERVCTARKGRKGAHHPSSFSSSATGSFSSAVSHLTLIHLNSRSLTHSLTKSPTCPCRIAFSSAWLTHLHPIAHTSSESLRIKW